jgi:hypothetical protein
MFTTVMKWGFILVTLYMGNASSQGNPGIKNLSSTSEPYTSLGQGYVTRRATSLKSGRYPSGASIASDTPPAATCNESADANPCDH